jgi:hypothetical protein
VRLPRLKFASAAAHFVWLLGAAMFLFAGVIWSGANAHAVALSPEEEAVQQAARAEESRAALLGRLDLAGIALRRAGPPTAVVNRLPTTPTTDERDVALARYLAAVGTSSVETAVAQSGAQLAQQVLSDGRIHLTSAGRADVGSGRVDPRVLAVLLYLAEAHGEVSVSCLITGHSRFVAQTKQEKKRKVPRRVSAHISGRAVDVSAVGGVPILGHQLPGGVADRAIRELLALPAALQPRQIISLLDLSGPSFRLPDHADHIHIGY